MTARIFTLSDAIAERARDVRCLAYVANNRGDWMKADELLQRARELEVSASYARPRGMRSCTSFAHDPVPA